MSWMNNDGLYVRFGTEEADLALGGEIENSDLLELIFKIDYREALTATPTILGTALQPGAYGVVVPEGVRIEEMEVVVETPFTSSGTIGSSTLVIGTKKDSDRSTELDHDGLTTSSFVASVLDAAGEKTIVKPGVTGAGDDYGATTAESGVIVVSNSAHASHPYTAGVALVRLKYRKV